LCNVSRIEMLAEHWPRIGVQAALKATTKDADNDRKLRDQRTPKIMMQAIGRGFGRDGLGSVRERVERELPGKG
jgi:hypothetical protein